MKLWEKLVPKMILWVLCIKKYLILNKKYQIMDAKVLNL